MKLPSLPLTIVAAFLTAAATCPAQTNTTPLPREGANIPALATPRDRVYGISGPDAKHTAQWMNYNSKCTGSAVKAGLIPNLRPLIPGMQLRDTIVILGGDGNYYMTGSSGADIWEFNEAAKNSSK